jgi:hypothetical protein
MTAVRATLDLFDPTDPAERPCDECGAQAGEVCRFVCTAWPAILAAVDAEPDLGTSPAGRLAVALATELRAAHLPAVPTTSGGGGVAVVLSHRSGRDWMVIAVEVWRRGEVFYVGQYADDETTDGAIEQVEIHDRTSAVRAILDLAARTGAQEDQR